MRHRSTILAALVFALAGCSGPQKPATLPAAQSSSGCRCSVYFSPNGGCTDAIVSAVAGARKSILVQAYSFTSSRIAKALLEARKRGVDVRVILDGATTDHQYSPADFFANSGISVRLDYAHAVAHNKLMVIDGETIITGSFNFTKAAESKNAENVLIIRDNSLAARYADNWREHEAHSVDYRGRGDDR